MVPAAIELIGDKIRWPSTAKSGGTIGEDTGEHEAHPAAGDPSFAFLGADADSQYRGSRGSRGSRVTTVSERGERLIRKRPSTKPMMPTIIKIKPTVVRSICSIESLTA